MYAVYSSENALHASSHEWRLGAIENPKMLLDWDAGLALNYFGDGQTTPVSLNTERPWMFRQNGTGPGSHLELRCTSGKKFLITGTSNNTDFPTALEVVTGDDGRVQTNPETTLPS